jgi:hypothetical protein
MEHKEMELIQTRLWVVNTQLGPIWLDYPKGSNLGRSILLASFFVVQRISQTPLAT